MEGRTAYGKLGLANILLKSRGEGLRKFNFYDAYNVIKQRENEASFVFLPDLLVELHSTSELTTKQVHNTNKSSEDVISSMPESVITNILDCLPIQDVVRTCILSKNWRLMWTLVTQVSFDGITRYLEGIGPEGKYRYDGKNLTRLLCHLNGPVRKFVFTIPNNMALDVEDINQWILLVSLKGIKDIALINKHETTLKLPTHLFSCPELKHLNLHNCCLHSPPANPINLLSLELDQVTLEDGNCGDIITHAPLLEVLKIGYHDPIGKVKLVDIAKLENLKTLHIPLRMIDENIVAITSSSVFELGAYLPKLQELCLYLHKCNLPQALGATKWVSTAFPCLNSLALLPVRFRRGSLLSCVVGMIWCSPNLRTLKITATYNNSRLSIASFFSDNNTIWHLQQLRHVVLTSLSISITQIDLIKHLLAYSPLLKKIIIHTRIYVSQRAKWYLVLQLLMCPRASPKAQVHLM